MKTNITENLKLPSRGGGVGVGTETPQSLAANMWDHRLHGLLCDETLVSMRANCSHEHATQDPSQLERVQDDHRAVLAAAGSMKMKSHAKLLQLL